MPEAGQDVKEAERRLRAAERDAELGHLYSISAWGTRMTKKHPLVQPLLGGGTCTINAGIGIRWDRKTGEFRIAVSVCNPKDRFVKKVARSILRGRLDSWSPVNNQAIATYGCYHGDRPISELFTPITKGFRDAFLTLKNDGVYRGEYQKRLQAILDNMIIAMAKDHSKVFLAGNGWSDGQKKTYGFQHICGK